MFESLLSILLPRANRAARTVAPALLGAMLIPCGLVSDSAFAQAQPIAQMGPDVFGGFPTTHVIVRVKPGVAPAQVADGRWTFNPPANAKVGGKKAPANQSAAALLNTMQQNQVRGVRASDVSHAANAALASQIGLDRYYHIQVPPGTDVQRMVTQLLTFTTMFEVVELDSIGGIAGLIPDDPEFAGQWNMHNTGQGGGVEDADVDGPEAWNIIQGDDTITLGIVDSGVQYAHPDLAGRILPGWNTNETPNNSNAEDVHGHGTHVAGIAAAAGNNGFGVAGMNWNINILPVRCVSSGGFGTEAMCAAGITWAADHGADIISMSLQYYGGTTELRDAVVYAHNLGILLIGAAGNFQVPGTVAFPARWPECLGVAATNRFDGIYFGSNSGNEVDIAAPGQDVLSLWRNSDTQVLSGTSMAAPHVSGLASLIMERNPALTREQVIEVLTTTATDKGLAGWDPSFGHGLVKAPHALYVALPDDGDVNYDHLVNIQDLLAVIAAWGECPPVLLCPSDVDSSGLVDISDLLEVIANWG